MLLITCFISNRYIFNLPIRFLTFKIKLLTKSKVLKITINGFSRNVHCNSELYHKLLISVYIILENNAIGTYTLMVLPYSDSDFHYLCLESKIMYLYKYVDTFYSV